MSSRTVLPQNHTALQWTLQRYIPRYQSWQPPSGPLTGHRRWYRNQTGQPCLRRNHSRALRNHISAPSHRWWTCLQSRRRTHRPPGQLQLRRIPPEPPHIQSPGPGQLPVRYPGQCLPSLPFHFQTQKGQRWYLCWWCTSCLRPPRWFPLLLLIQLPWYPRLLQSLLLLCRRPATVNAMMAAMDNAINFFIITSSSTDRNKIRVTLINLSPLTCYAPASSWLL